SNTNIIGQGKCYPGLDSLDRVNGFAPLGAVCYDCSDPGGEARCSDALPAVGDRHIDIPPVRD
ncbi:MAG: hypothetical protein RDU83_11370, partial [bacterium]|nr:hypothetical protein [bacterium]